LTMDELIAKMNNLDIDKHRFELFKKHIQQEYPRLGIGEIISIYSNRDLLTSIYRWNEYHRLMQLLEFDMEKSNLDSL
jgi:hypothetical protein